MESMMQGAVFVQTNAAHNEVVAFTRTVVYRYGALLKSLQVMNEVNNNLSPDASDGAYPGARDALPQAIIAAAQEKRGIAPDLEIGMNWFYRLDPQHEYEFWTELGAKGGPELARSLDWVGLDAYPGTFFPPGSRYRESMVNAMSSIRCYAARAGIPESKPIHIEENGYPTGPSPDRSERRQVDVMKTLVNAVNDFRGTYNVSDYRWFDLRDHNSASSNFQHRSRTASAVALP